MRSRIRHVTGRESRGTWRLLGRVGLAWSASRTSSGVFCGCFGALTASGVPAILPDRSAQNPGANQEASESSARGNEPIEGTLRERVAPFGTRGGDSRARRGSRPPRATHRGAPGIATQRPATTDTAILKRSPPDARFTLDGRVRTEPSRRGRDREQAAGPARNGHRRPPPPSVDPHPPSRSRPRDPSAPPSQLCARRGSSPFVPSSLGERPLARPLAFGVFDRAALARARIHAARVLVRLSGRSVIPCS